MNAALEQKIKECLQEAERQGSSAVYSVMHLLLGNLHNGTQRDFAKHCCRFSDLQLRARSQAVYDPEEAWEDFAELDAPGYYN